MCINYEVSLIIMLFFYYFYKIGIVSTAAISASSAFL